MNTDSKKFYKNFSERSVVREKERTNYPTYVGLIKLAYSESTSLLSLYEHYTEVLDGNVLSAYSEADLHYIDSELDRIESRLCVLLHNFLSYSKALPDPWKMIKRYNVIYYHFHSINMMFQFEREIFY